MSAFHYELRQRVVVPGGDGCQGIVVSRQEFIDQAPEYRLRFLTEDGATFTDVFCEAVITEAQLRQRAINRESALRELAQNPVAKRRARR